MICMEKKALWDPQNHKLEIAGKLCPGEVWRRKEQSTFRGTVVLLQFHPGTEGRGFLSWMGAVMPDAAPSLPPPSLPTSPNNPSFWSTPDNPYFWNSSGCPTPEGLRQRQRTHQLPLHKAWGMGGWTQQINDSKKCSPSSHDEMGKADFLMAKGQRVDKT